MKKPHAVEVQSAKFRFRKLNVRGREWRDIYHWLLTLTWPQFTGLVLSLYLSTNVLFASLYLAGQPCINGLPRNSFSDAFFFSVETLATVGYGHMYPETPYGHLVATLEIICGIFGVAVMTGLIFVRFSRPSARLEYSRVMVISNYNGKPALMFRVANLRHQPLAEAEFRVMIIRREPTLEDEGARRFHFLPLQTDRMILFPVALVIRHIIDEKSPLHGVGAENLIRSQARILVSVVSIDTVIPASVHSQYSYLATDILFGHRFVEIYHDNDDHSMDVDYARISDTEPAPMISWP